MPCWTIFDYKDFVFQCYLCCLFIYNTIHSPYTVYTQDHRGELSMLQVQWKYRTRWFISTISWFIVLPLSHSVFMSWSLCVFLFCSSCQMLIFSISPLWLFPVLLWRFAHLCPSPSWYPSVMSVSVRMVSVSLCPFVAVSVTLPVLFPSWSVVQLQLFVTQFIDFVFWTLHQPQ